MALVELTPWLALSLVLGALLVIGGTLRLTRLITTDSLGEWALRGPLTSWAVRHEQARRAAVREVIATTNPETSTPEGVYFLSRLQSQLDDETEWMSWQGRLVSGLYCPFCVGFWIGLIVLLLTLAMPLVPAWLGLTWVMVLSALTLNYIIGHISSRID